MVIFFYFLVELLFMIKFKNSYLAISHAMARDGSSGGVIRLVIIDQAGVEKEVVLGKLNSSYL